MKIRKKLQTSDPWLKFDAQQMSVSLLKKLI